MKIVVLDGFTVNPGDLSWAPLEALGAMTCHDETPDPLRVERVGDAEIILVNRTPIDRQTIFACSRLKYIGVFATGYNMIDVEAARERGIVVVNVPHYGMMAVAQHGMALLLHIANRVCRYDAEVKAGMWTRDPDYAYRDTLPLELAGLTLGVIGYGAIGRAFAAMGLAMGMDVIATRRNMSGPPEDSHVSYVGKHELFERADVVSLHVPLTTETTGMINAAAISIMKNGVIIVNTSRGGLLIESDVAAGLRSGKVAALGTDVAAVEPIRADNPLLDAPNCFFTPHIAWAPRATRRRLLDLTVENVAAFLAGKPMNVVN